MGPNPQFPLKYGENNLPIRLPSLHLRHLVLRRVWLHLLGLPQNRHQLNKFVVMMGRLVGTGRMG